MKKPPKKTKSRKAAKQNARGLAISNSQRATNLSGKTRKLQTPEVLPAAPVDIFALRMDTEALASMAGITPRRVNQMKIEGGLKAGADGLFSATDFLKAYFLYDSPRGEALRARTRQVNARALETEQRVRREQRWLLNLEEMRGISLMILERATESIQADSSRFFSEYQQSHTELESLEMTHRLFDPLTALAVGWRNGVEALLKLIEGDHLPRTARLDEVLDILAHEISAAQIADEKNRIPTQGT